MKRFERIAIITITILVSLMAMTMMISAKSGDITVKVNGKTVSFPDQPPVVQNERTLVPVRFVAEALGYDVVWNQADNSVVIDDGKIVLYIGTNTAKIDGKTVTLDVKSTVIQNRTMVPLRMIAETLNCSVDWISETKTVLVNAKKNGRELSVYERLKQTGLYYDLKDNRGNELTRFLVKKTLVKAGADLTNSDQARCWMVD